LILIAYRHALRVSELCSLRWDAVDLQQGLLSVRRVKNGTPSTHPIRGVELRALRRLQREYPDCPYVFNGERKGPLTTSSARKIVARAGVEAGLEFPVHPHMLRHAAGFYLANSGIDTRAIQHYLGHRNITHTVRYTELSPERFKEFWQDWSGIPMTNHTSGVKMKTENMLKACETYEVFNSQLRDAHRDAVNSCDQFAEIVLYSLLEEAAKMDNQLKRIKEAARWKHA
jgi:hypothetical protein